jgi:hypothetical protein
MYDNFYVETVEEDDEGENIIDGEGDEVCL